MEEKEKLFISLTVDIMRELGYDLDSDMKQSAEFVAKMSPVVEKAFNAGVQSTMKMLEMKSQMTYLNAIPTENLHKA